MPGGMSGTIGREQELEAVAGFMTGLRHGLAALVFAGEPGIGKTTVWRDAVGQAEAAACAVLSARPAEAEAGLAYAGLADLLDPVADQLLPGLLALQRRALEVALLREEPDPEGVDQRAVSAATNSALRFLSARGPVLLAVDDLQWLDRPSARVLEFALRRLADAPVGVLACERVAQGVRLPMALDRVAREERFTRIRLGPLDPESVRQLLTGRLTRPFSRRLATRIQHATGGNPLFALELARSLPPDASADAPSLPVPGPLLELVQARIVALPGEVRRLLLAAAALPVPTAESVRAAVGGGDESLLALEHAEASGIIEADGQQLRFTHPLYAGAVQAMAPASERRRMHRVLAALAGDIEEQALHLALSASGPDAGLAARLEAAAERGRARGAPESAAELAGWALALTPASLASDTARRTVRAAEYHFHAGELGRARTMLRKLLACGPADRDRADALRLLGEIHYHQDSFDEATRVLREALEYVGDDRALRLAIEISLAFTMVSVGDFAAASHHAARALELASPATEPASAAQALAVAAMAGFLMGNGMDEATLERALRLEDRRHQVPALVRPSLIAGCLALFQGCLARCDSHLLPLREQILESGEEAHLVTVSGYLIWSAAWRGDLARAEAYSAEAIDVAARIGSDSQRCMALAFAAIGSAYAGDMAQTERRAGDAIALAARTGYQIAVLWARWALGLFALSRGDYAAADSAMGPLAGAFADGVPDPVRAFFLPDEIEALIGLGELDRAGRLLTSFEEAARRLDRQWAIVLAGRCRALLRAARGDLDGACAKAAEAVSGCAGLELGIEVARTYLTAGQVERRGRHKSAAAEHLRQAAGLLEQMGARAWAVRARAELDRVGLRPPAPAELTPSELRVAELIATGRTCREVGAELFMSPKTVEARLARVYRKLGVHTRAQLGGQLANLRQPPAGQT